MTRFSSRSFFKEVIILRLIGSIFDLFKQRTEEAEIVSVSYDAVASFALRRLALYIAVSYVANALSMCEFKTYEGGRAVKKELYYALNLSPNPNQNGSAFIVNLVESYFYDRHALMVQPVKGKNHYYIADSFGIDRQPLKDNVFESVSVEGLGLSKTFKASDACYFKLENYEVVGIVASVYQELGEILGAAVDSFVRAGGDRFLFTRASSQSGDRKDAKASSDEVNDMLKGFVKNPDGVLPLHSQQKFERLQANGNAPNASDIVSLRKDIFEETASAFKIPLSMMSGNMTNTNDVVNQFITFGVDPFAEMVSEELTRKFYPYLAWDGGKNRIEIDTSTINHVDMFQVADKAEKLVSSGLFNIDEVRKPLRAEMLGTDFSQAHWITKNYSLIQDALAQLTATEKGGDKESDQK